MQTCICYHIILVYYLNQNTLLYCPLPYLKINHGFTTNNDKINNNNKPSSLLNHGTTN